jgi:hypothetical protein
MAVALSDGSPFAILAELERLLKLPSDFGEEFEKIDLGDWTSVHVYLPQPDVQSAITPPFMEAFLVLQKQLYQLAALAKTGSADVGQLGEAEILRTPSRKKAQQKIIQQEVKVVDINTTDPFDLQIVLLDPSSDIQHRIKFKDDLFAGENRHKLFDALEKRATLWVELAVKEVDGEVRSVQLLRTIERPAGITEDIAGDN